MNWSFFCFVLFCLSIDCLPVLALLCAFMCEWMQAVYRLKKGVPFKFQQVVILSTHCRTHGNTIKHSEALPCTVISPLPILSEEKLIFFLNILVSTLLPQIYFSLSSDLYLALLFVWLIGFELLGMGSQNMTWVLFIIFIASRVIGSNRHISQSFVRTRSCR